MGNSLDGAGCFPGFGQFAQSFIDIRDSNMTAAEKWGARITEGTFGVMQAWGGVVPPIGGVPAPIDTVVPPVGSPPPSGDEGDVFTQDAFQDFLKFLESVAKSVDDEARNKQQDQSGRLGDKEADELEMVNKATQFWSPQERLAFYLDLGAKMARQTQDQFGRRNLTAELKKMGEVARDANVIARGAWADLGVVVNYDKDGRPYVYDPNAHLRGLVDPTPGVVGLAANRLGSQLSPGFKNFALNKSLGGAVGIDVVYAAIGIVGGVVAGVKIVNPRGYSGRYADGQKAYRTNVPRDGKNNLIPDPSAVGEHTRLQRDAVDPSRIYSATEFDANGQPVKRIDFAGRPGDPLPHEHPYDPLTKGFGDKRPLRR